MTQVVDDVFLRLAIHCDAVDLQQIRIRVQTGASDFEFYTSEARWLIGRASVNESALAKESIFCPHTSGHST